MNTSTFTVAGMTCSHCASSVREEVGRIDGVESVDVDLASGVITVGSLAPVDAEVVKTAVEEAGYHLAS